MSFDADVLGFECGTHRGTSSHCHVGVLSVGYLTSLSASGLTCSAVQKRAHTHTHTHTPQDTAASIAKLQHLIKVTCDPTKTNRRVAMVTRRVAMGTLHAANGTPRPMAMCEKTQRD